MNEFSSKRNLSEYYLPVFKVLQFNSALNLLGSTGQQRLVHPKACPVPCVSVVGLPFCLPLLAGFPSLSLVDLIMAMKGPSSLTLSAQMT